MKNKVALVTGSTKGIGLSIGEKLENNGYDVIYNGKSQIKKNKKHFIKGDISKKITLDKLDRYIGKHFKKIDLLVNNVGYTKYIHPTKLNKINDNLFNKIININFKSHFNCTIMSLKYLKKSPKSNIINIASIAGINGKGSNVVYSASKAALINLTKSLALYLKPIRVNSISPGYIKTDFVKFPKKYYIEMIKKTPLERGGVPEDISDVVISLLSMEYVTGHNIVVDGGRILN